jgi:hypothetical protein
VVHLSDPGGPRWRRTSDGWIAHRKQAAGGLVAAHVPVRGAPTFSGHRALVNADLAETGRQPPNGGAAAKTIG